MTQFDPITVYSANRNATKVGIVITLTVNITTPSYTDQMVISFPTSQVITTGNCSVKVNGVDRGCSVLNSTAVMTASVAGNAVYVIGGLTNQLYFISSAKYDLITVNLGNPYSRASTISTTSTYVTPILTLGTITLNSATSSSLTLLSATTLTYNFTI